MMNEREYMCIDKLSEESKLDYHRRLVYGKLVDKTLSDMDYTELAEALYGAPYASDVARRMMYGSRKTLEVVDEWLKDGKQADDSDSIDSRMIDLQAERKRLADQRRELTKLITSKARADHLESVIKDSAERLNETVGILFDDGSVGAYDECSEAVVVLSDWHYGMTADNIFNKYNTEICVERVSRVVNMVTDRLTLHKCNKLHVVLLGDFIHGAIHVSARVAAEELVTDQIMQVSEILAQAINKMSGYVAETHVHMTYGNHARVVQNKPESVHRDNMERLIGWWLKYRLAGNTSIVIEEEYPHEFIVFSANGHWICATHGDLDMVKTSPRIVSSLISRKYGVDIKCFILGDKHHKEEFEELGVDSMLCGSLCGTDDYANEKRLYSMPSQLMLIFNNDGIDAEYHLRCGMREHHSEEIDE